MRIAYICADAGVPVFGRKGSSIHVQEVLRALLCRGVRIELFAARLDGDTPPGLEPVRVHQLPPVPKNCIQSAQEWASFQSNGFLKKTLEYEGPFDMVYERYSLWSFAGMEYAQDKGIPGILEVNAPLIKEQSQFRVLIDRARAEWVAEQAFKSAGILIAVSREIAEYIKSHYPEVRAHVYVVPNAVNPERFSKNSKPSCPGRPETFTMGFVGTMKPWHGLSILVEAFALLQKSDPNIRLLVAGDGPERKRLKENLSNHGLLENVILTGSVDHSEVPGLLASMDVAVAPYTHLAHFYFSPLKIYEYMAMGLPIIASRIGQVAELIQDGVNGILCPPGDPGALADAIRRLQCEPMVRSKLGQAAKETILKGHTWDAVVRTILQLASNEFNNPVKLG